MRDPENAPELVFECPRLWESMPGSEESRFCDSCGHQVYNLSLLSPQERAQLLARSRKERVCATFCQDLEGRLITANSAQELSAKLKTARLAALAAGSLALSACSRHEPDHGESIPLPGIICAPEEEAG